MNEVQIRMKMHALRAEHMRSALETIARVAKLPLAPQSFRATLEHVSTIASGAIALDDGIQTDNIHDTDVYGQLLTLAHACRYLAQEADNMRTTLEGKS